MTELTFDQLDEIQGGILPLIAAFVGGAVAGAAFAYYNAE